MSHTSDIRRSVAAGRFYPGVPEVLRSLVAGFLAQVPESERPGEGRFALALMAPHAGYVFSGAIAGQTIGRVRLAPVVLLVAPNHTGRGAAFSVWDGGAWETPLGLMPVDRSLAEAVCALPGFSPDREAHVADHAIEVLLPFLQVHSPSSAIVPVCIGAGSPRDLRTAGEALGALIAEKRAAGSAVTMLVSSDMNHFLPHQVSVRRDALALERIKGLDPDGLYRVVRENAITMCGMLPMTMVMHAAKTLGATQGRVIAYATSGETGKAYGAGLESVVGYAGIVIE